MMAMVRLNVPERLRLRRRDAARPLARQGRDASSPPTKASARCSPARMTEAELDELGHACAPTLGSCPGQFTANTMAMVAETLGLALPGSAMLPAVYTERLALARRAGRRATEIVQRRRAAAARPGHAQVARERLRRGRRHRRLDQRRPAPAGDRARGRHPLHARRRRRGVRAHAADRRPAAGRALPRPRPAPRRRRRRRC